MIFYAAALVIQQPPLDQKSVRQERLLREFISSYCRGEKFTAAQQKNLRLQFEQNKIDTFSYYQLMLLMEKSEGKNKTVDTRMLRNEELKKLLRTEAELASQKSLTIAADDNRLQMIQSYLNKSLEQQSTYCRYLYEKFHQRLPKEMEQKIRWRLLLVDGKEEQISASELQQNTWLLQRILKVYQEHSQRIKLAVLENFPAERIDKKLALMAKGGFDIERQRLLADLVYPQQKSQYKAALIASLAKNKDENVLKKILTQEKDEKLLQTLVNAINEDSLLQKLLPLLEKRNIHNLRSLELSSRKLLLAGKRPAALKLLQTHPQLVKGKLHELYEKIAWLEGVNLDYQMPLLKTSVGFISGDNKFFIMQPETPLPLRVPNENDLFTQFQQLNSKPYLIKFFLNSAAAPLLKFVKPTEQQPGKEK